MARRGGGAAGIDVKQTTARHRQRRRSKRRQDRKKRPAAEGQAGAELRSNFAETAFWQPHLLTGADGTATIEFTVPDSVTSWRVFVHGVTRDLEGGTLEAEAKSVKDLMVRPYLPRFFREGDTADLRVMVNNAGTAALTGEVTLEITDPVTGENLAPAFGLPAVVPARAFKVEAGGGTPVVFPLAAPARVGTVAFKVTAKSGSSVGRRAAAAPGPSRADASRPVAVRDAQGRQDPRAPLRRHGQDRRPDAHQRAARRHGRRAALLRAPRGPPLPHQLPLRVHGADAQPVPVDRHPDEPLRQVSAGRARWPRS